MCTFFNSKKVAFLSLEVKKLVKSRTSITNLSGKIGFEIYPDFEVL